LITTSKAGPWALAAVAALAPGLAELAGPEVLAAAALSAAADGLSGPGRWEQPAMNKQAVKVNKEVCPRRRLECPVMGMNLTISAGMTRAPFRRKHCTSHQRKRPQREACGRCEPKARP
jgi:hypothetical protein